MRSLRSLGSLAAFLVSLALASSCGSSATTSTSPTSLTRCAVSANGAGQVPAQGGTGSVSVSAARECAWRASVEGSWLSIRNGATGQGDGAVEFSAVANPDPAVRRGAIVLNEQKIDVVQEAAECAYTLSEPSSTIAQSGGTGAFDVRASSALCSWTAQTDVPWIELRNATGRGTAPVQFEVAATTGPPRTGTITAAGLRFTVTQSAGCSFSVTPASHNAPAAGGPLTLTVTTAAQCPWTASSVSPWMTATTPAAATGPGSVTFAIAPTTSARSGSVVVAGQTVPVTQSGGGGQACTFSISPQSASVPASGGSGSIAVTAPAGCAWAASSHAGWLQITGPASGSGSGEVSYQASAGGSRTGTLTVAGRTFTVTQGSACTYSISPEQHGVEAAGGTFAVTVSAGAGCDWTASSNAGWITVRSAGRESGGGSVQVVVAPNTGEARSGTATIAGRTLTVNQAAAAAPACRYRVSPTDLKADEDDRVERVAIETSPGCTWTAVSQASWIRVVNESGSGSASVWLVLERGNEKRVGTVIVAGETVTVRQKD